MVQPPAVVIHGAAHLRAALEPGLPVLLLSGAGAGDYAGAAWWHALTGSAGQPAALDCADRPGRALEAFAAGCRLVVLLPCPAWHQVASRAGPARILSARPPALDLLDPAAARRLHAWLRDTASSG